jgi:hypothetical protein
MTVQQPLNELEVLTEGRVHYAFLDQTYHFKIRAFVDICMPPVFTQLFKSFDMFGLRRRGVSTVMVYCDFETLRAPVAYGRQMDTRCRTRLYRSVEERPGAEGARSATRLLLSSALSVHARLGTGARDQFGYDAGDSEEIEAGRAEVLQVITRPLAPPGQRQVAEVPPELQGLRAHEWERPYPTADLLRDVPAGFAAQETGGWQDRVGVWGLPNTDLNQHVTVTEYIEGVEDYATTRLFGAGQPVARHHLRRARVLYRKPFFAGEAYVIKGNLYRRGADTLLLGGFHKVAPEGQLDGTPSVFARLEGVVHEATE